MSLINLPYTFSTGNTIIAAQHNSNNSTIYNDYNGNISDNNISAAAGIEYTKLALTGTIKQSDMLSTFNSSSGFGFVPSGGIIMWHGTIATIPTGWFLCNGSNGTPDLRNQFVVCANADVSGVACTTLAGGTGVSSGGSTIITQANLPSYNISVPGYFGNGSGLTGLQGTTNGASLSSVIASSGGSGTTYTQPYYALAYIMKS